jgi:hypothetical protein
MVMPEKSVMPSSTVLAKCMLSFSDFGQRCRLRAWGDADSCDWREIDSLKARVLLHYVGITFCAKKVDASRAEEFNFVMLSVKRLSDEFGL